MRRTINDKENMGKTVKCYTLDNKQQIEKPILIKNDELIVHLLVDRQTYMELYDNKNDREIYDEYNNIKDCNYTDKKQNENNNHIPKSLINCIKNMNMEKYSNYYNEMEKSDYKLANKNLHNITDLDIKLEKVIFKYIGSLDENLINKKINNKNISNKKIHVILSSYKNKPWPTSSPYVCWNCTEPFQNAPVGIPTIANTNIDKYKETYYFDGNFCSFNCAARYLNDDKHTNEYQSGTLYEILNFIYNELYQTETYQKIKLAPERYTLKKFGGILTIDEYRYNFINNIDYKIFKTPIIPSLNQIQETISK